MNDFTLLSSDSIEELNAEICTTHNQKPNVVFVETGIIYNACCDEFQEFLIERTKEMIIRDGRDSIRRLFGL